MFYTKVICETSTGRKIEYHNVMDFGVWERDDIENRILELTPVHLAEEEIGQILEKLQSIFDHAENFSTGEDLDDYIISATREVTK